jgi:hypothetical protein
VDFFNSFDTSFGVWISISVKFIAAYNTFKKKIVEYRASDSITFCTSAFGSFFWPKAH